jgi:hypothetical protein
MKTFLPMLFAFSGALLAVDGAGVQKAPVITSVKGYLLDEITGLPNGDDVFGRGYVPVNQHGVGLLIVATVDLGRECAMPVPSDGEARAISRGDAKPPQRPVWCDRQTGAIAATVSVPTSVTLNVLGQPSSLVREIAFKCGK